MAILSLLLSIFVVVWRGSADTVRCPPNEILKSVKNEDGELKIQCIPLDCDNINDGTFSCSRVWKRYCIPSREFVVGIQLRIGSSIGKYGHKIRNHLYLVQCCSHSMLSQYLIASFPVNLDPSIDKFEAINSAEVGFYASNLQANRNSETHDHYTLTAINVRCRDKTTTSTTTATTTRDRPTKRPEPPVIPVVPVDGPNGFIDSAPPAQIEPPVLPPDIDPPPRKPTIDGLDEGAVEDGGSDGSSSCAGIASRIIASQNAKLASHGKSAIAVTKNTKGLCHGGRGASACSERCRQTFGTKYINSICFPIPGRCPTKICVCVTREEQEQRNKEEEVVQEKPVESQIDKTAPRETKELDAIPDPAPPYAPIPVASPIGGGAGACFSADSLVQTRTGQTRMKDLSVLDEILTSLSGNVSVYQKVTSFLHRDPDVMAEFLEIQTQSGNVIELTHKHLLMVVPNCGNDVMTGDFDATFQRVTVFAEKAKIGDCLVLGTRLLDEIASVQKTNKRGIFSPVTENGQIIVNNLHASCYSHFENHFLQHTVFRLYRSIMESVTRPLEYLLGIGAIPANRSKIDISRWAYWFQMMINE